MDYTHFRRAGNDIIVKIPRTEVASITADCFLPPVYFGAAAQAKVNYAQRASPPPSMPARCRHGAFDMLKLRDIMRCRYYAIRYFSLDLRRFRVTSGRHAKTKMPILRNR